MVLKSMPKPTAPAQSFFGDNRVSTDQTRAAFEGLSRRTAPENGTPALDIYEPYGPPAPYEPSKEKYIYRASLTPGAMRATDAGANMDAWRADMYQRQFGPNGEFNPANDTIGPDGSKLPVGAKGWDYNGQAFYGDGIQGMWEEYKNKVLFGSDPYAGDVVAKKKAAFSAPGMDPNKVREAGEVVDLWATAGNWWKKFVEGNDSPVGIAARAVQETVGGTIQNFGDVGGKGTKAVLGAAEGLANAGEGSFLPDVRDRKWSDWFNQALINKAQQNARLRGTPMENIATPDEMPGWDTLLNKINAIAPPMLAYNAIRAFTSPQEWEEKGRDIVEGYQSARIMYSTFLQPALQQEYISRLRAGENPYLLEQELANPTAEMIGELVFDPLNLIGAGPSKAARSAGRIDDAYRVFLKQYPELEGVMKGITSNMGEALSAEKLDEFVKVQQNISEAVAKGWDEFVFDTGITQLTQSGKSYGMGRRVGTVLQNIGANADNPEEALEYMRFLVQMHGSPDEIATAVAGLRRFSIVGRGAMTQAGDLGPKLLFSRAGQETGLLLRRVMEDADGVVDVKKFLGDLAAQKTPKEMVEFAAKKIAAAGDTMFPDMGKRLSVAQKAKSGKQLTAMEARIARMGPVTAREQAIYKLTQGLDKVYKPLNSMFAGVYMGLSPGFAFRNLLTNSFHVLIDEGPSALFRKPAAVMDEITETLGYRPNIGGFGSKAMGGDVTETGLFGVGGKGLPMQKLSEVFEEWAATQAYGAGVRKTMAQMLQEGKAIPSTAELVSKGWMNQQDANALVSLVKKYKGNVGKATEEFLRQFKAGEIDALFNMDWMTDAQRAQLSDYNTLDKITKILDDARANNKPVDEVMGELGKVFGEYADEAAAVADDVPTVNPQALDADVIPLMVDSGVDKDTMRLATSYIQANDLANGAYTRAVKEAFEEAMLRTKGDINAQGSLYQWFAKAQGFFDGSDAAAVRKATARRRDTTVLWRDRSFKGDFDIAEAWAQLGMGGQPPANVYDFRNAIWGEYYFPFARDQWQRYRDIHVSLGEQMFTALEQSAPGLNRNELIKAQAQYNMARQWDGVLRDDQVRKQLVVALNRGDNPGAARAYAKQYGLDAPTDQHILNTVNKYAPDTMPGSGEAIKYGHLAEVPPEVAQKAFVRRLADKAGAAAFDPLMPAEVKIAKAAEIRKQYLRGEQLITEMSDKQREYVMAQARNMRQRVTSGMPESKGRAANQLGEGALSAYSSTYPAWYGPLKRSKAEVEAALDNMAQGIDKHTQLYDNLRVAAVNEMYDMTETNPLAFWELGDYEKAVERFDDWMNEGIELGDLPQEAGYDEMFTAWERWKKGGPEALWADLPEPGIAKVSQTATQNIPQVEAVGPKFTPKPVPEDVMKLYDAEQKARQKVKDLRGLAKEQRKTNQTGGFVSAELTMQDAEKKAKGAGMELSAALKKAGITRDDIRAAVDPNYRPMEYKVTAQSAPPIPASPYAGEVATPGRMLTEQQEGLQALFKKIGAHVENNYDAPKRAVYNNPGMAKAVQDWGRTASSRIAEARAIANKVGEAAKDFTVLSYPEKRNLDLALAYVYPFHFWYNRTYGNWLKRLAYNPEIIAGYAKYREAMEETHAGAPEWWKYNTAVTSLLGMDLENPLFFNLEATLNPLNGLTGVDFKDPYKRVNWWTATMDDMNRFGPSTWTPFSYATAVALKMQGEDEAASRWGGRLIPQTATIKAALAMAGADIYKGTREAGSMGGMNELDPMVHIFAGGIDPYERRRVGRALASLVDEGFITQAQAVDAAQKQKGEIWDTALERAIKDRGWGQISSFFLGVGFKGRNQTDMQIDLMDQEWRMLWAQAPDMTPEELRGRMDDLRTRYPFMDAVILSRKAGFARDRSYAYNVIGRIPPGQKGDIAEMAGIDPRLFDKFYADKGDITKWAETDRIKFMAGIVDIGARLNMPDATTRQEWELAKSAYGKIDATLKARYGDDILNRVEHYFFLKGSDDKTAADAYLKANPDVSEALDYKDATIVENPDLAPYYSSIDTIERYYRGVMYDAIRAEIGDMGAVWDGLDEAKLNGTEKQYRREHPEIGRYYDLRDQYQKWVDAAILRAAQGLGEAVYPELRDDNPVDSIGEMDVTAGVTDQPFNPYDLTWQDVQGDMPPTLQRLVLDTILNGEELSYAAKKQLEYIAQGYGVDADMLIEILANNYAP